MNLLKKCKIKKLINNLDSNSTNELKSNDHTLRNISLIVFFVLLSSLAFVFYFKSSESVNLGLDENNCIPQAGYQWNESIGACVRNWELKEFNKSQAAKIAVDYVGTSPGLTVINVEVLLECSDCFKVHLSTLDSQTKELKIRNWKVSV